ncbi:MAG: winged helix-turn-helix transcriptional regulator [Clostridia bacterium]|nr:winged helix-turn-helix transcriptional regulator [Clostridia bacterium]
MERFHTFTTQIAKISRSIRKIKTEEMKEFDLKSPHVSCLYYLYKESSGLTATKLCDICDEDKAAISRSIEYLENNGYIECNSKTEKRYNSPLLLTEKGKNVGKHIANRIDNVLQLASVGITDENRAVFYQSLKIISENLQKISNMFGG